mmetsp:Transcript_22659/g.67065  ORF Transcript_22659/g.67065 Transcript_22659/m.67065 type:complete len:210 (+) Transcript_22659:1342-1971(+)
MNADGRAGESHGPREEEYEEYYGQAHGDVGDSTRPFDPEGEARPDDGPYDEEIEHVGPYDAGGTDVVPVQRGHADHPIVKVRGGVVPVNVLPIVLHPPERFEERPRHPRDQRDVIRRDEEAAQYRTQSYPPQAFVHHIAEATDVSGATMLSHRDFQYEHGYPDERQCERVRHEEGSSSVLVRQRREAPYVAESHRGPYRGEEEGGTAAP